MSTQRSRRPGSRFVELYTPKLVTVLREGYGRPQLQADALAGLTVAIVALPLSMAIAIASGVSPERGLYTAIFGGFLVSLLGGSRFQIGGPAGAFIVLVLGTVMQHGVDGLVLATFLSGLMLLVAGFLRAGTYVKFIPYPVTVGFTAGIAVIIFTSQLKDLLGLTFAVPEPGPFLDKLPVLLDALPTSSPAAMGLAASTIVLIEFLKHWRPRWPGLLLAVTIAAVVARVLDLPVETIGTRFGGIPSGLPLPSLPVFDPALVLAVLPNALAFTLLGAIESLLSAVVADGMTGRRHRSNCELVAQGIANLGAAAMGGFCVTGTIARTATNVRAGAHGPVAGMLHSLFLLLFVLLAAPLASFIPLAALAGVLALVAWNMIERTAIATLLRSSWGDALVLVSTFLLTVFRDLSEAIVVGFALGAMVFIHRMSEMTAVEAHQPLVPEDQPDTPLGQRTAYEPPLDRDVVVYRIVGVFFFGAAAAVDAALDAIGDRHKALVVDFAQVPFLDSTAANTIEALARKAKRQRVALSVSGASPTVRRALLLHGVRPPEVTYTRTIEDAVERARRQMGAIAPA